MNHLATLRRTRAIHAILDEAVSLFAAHPELVAVYAENTYGESWEARYALGNGSSRYGRHAVVTLCEGVAYESRTYPGAVKFLREDVEVWPELKCHLLAKLNSGVTFAFWDCDYCVASCWTGATIEQCLHYAKQPGNREASYAIERGLCLFREQLCDSGHNCDPLTERCKVCRKGMSEIAKGESIDIGVKAEGANITVRKMTASEVEERRSDEALRGRCKQRLAYRASADDYGFSLAAYAGISFPITSGIRSVDGPPKVTPSAQLPAAAVSDARKSKVATLLAEMQRATAEVRMGLERKT